MNSNRMERIDSEIKSALSETLTYDIQNPKLVGTITTIVSVKTTADLKYCRVLISFFPDKDKEEKFFAIKNSVHFLRKQIAQKVKLRVVPELQFELDDSVSYSAKINTILASIKKEEK